MARFAELLKGEPFRGSTEAAELYDEIREISS
jgi:hypothetical protein